MTTTTHHANWAVDLADDISKAQRSIIITALSFLPPRVLKLDPMTRYWLALADAAKRGVAIQVALPAPHVSHPATLRNDAAVGELRKLGAVAVLVPPANLLHAKTICIDSLIAWVGSGNMTTAAASHNRECYLRTDDARAVAELAGFHARCFADGKDAP